MSRLTDRIFWAKCWMGNSSGYSSNIKYTAVYKKFDKLFKHLLEKENKKILEIGCGGGRWLIYFAKEFGYNVWGIDFSEIGCRIAEENLKRENVSGMIFCEDVFKTSLESEFFDVVYSFGLIEHFENPGEVIQKHLELLKEGGLLIIGIPNFRANLYYTLCKIFNKNDLLEAHNLNVMDLNNFKEILTDKVEILMLDHFGPINLNLVFSHTNNKILRGILFIINQVVGYATFYIRYRYFSAYIILIGRKATSCT